MIMKDSNTTSINVILVFLLLNMGVQCLSIGNMESKYYSTNSIGYVQFLLQHLFERRPTQYQVKHGQFYFLHSCMIKSWKSMIYFHRNINWNLPKSKTFFIKGRHFVFLLFWMFLLTFQSKERTLWQLLLFHL